MWRKYEMVILILTYKSEFFSCVGRLRQTEMKTYETCFTRSRYFS